MSGGRIAAVGLLDTHTHTKDIFGSGRPLPGSLYSCASLLTRALYSVSSALQPLGAHTGGSPGPGTGGPVLRCPGAVFNTRAHFPLVWWPPGWMWKQFLRKLEILWIEGVLKNGLLAPELKAMTGCLCTVCIWLSRFLCRKYASRGYAFLPFLKNVFVEKRIKSPFWKLNAGFVPWQPLPMWGL